MNLLHERVVNIRERMEWSAKEVQNMKTDLEQKVSERMDFTSHESDSDQPPPLTDPSNSEISEDSDVELVYMLSKPPQFPRQESKSGEKRANRKRATRKPRNRKPKPVPLAAPNLVPVAAPKNPATVHEDRLVSQKRLQGSRSTVPKK